MKWWRLPRNSTAWPHRYWPASLGNTSRRRAHVLVVAAQTGIHGFGRIDLQAVDGRNNPGHDGGGELMGHSQGPLTLVPVCSCESDELTAVFAEQPEFFLRRSVRIPKQHQIRIRLQNDLPP